jgi:DNA polymerase IIIc chi subunit
MTSCAGKWIVRVGKDNLIFTDYAEAQECEFQQLWAPLIRKALLQSKRIIVPAEFARQAEALRQEAW